MLAKKTFPNLMEHFKCPSVTNAVFTAIAVLLLTRRKRRPTSL